MQGPFFLKYNTAATIQFVLYTVTGETLQPSATIAVGDTKIVKDGGASANTTNTPVNEGNGIYSLDLTAAELSAERVTIVVDDVTATETFLGTALHVITYGNASATIELDLDVANVSASVQSMASNVITNDAMDDEVSIGTLYPLAGIWYDSSGSAGTTIGTHGLPNNPVSSFSDAITLAGNTGLDKILLLSDLTLTANPGELEILGLGKTVGSTPTVTGNSQHSLDTLYQNCALSGTWGATSSVKLIDGAVTGTVPLVYGKRIQIIGIWTPNVAGTITLDVVTTFSTTSTIDLSTNNVLAEILEFSGELTVTNMDATNTLLVVGTGKLTIDSSCTGGTVTSRGSKSVIDNSGGAVTLVQDTGVNLTQIGGESDPVDKWKRILDSTIDTTITSGGGSQTSWNATGIPTTNDDQLIDKVGVFVDGDAKLRGFVVRDYVDSTKTLTVDSLNVAPSDGDRFMIFA